MYSDIKSVQIVVSLLKQYGISHVVVSPGNRNIPLVRSFEADDFFTTYSVVDERSAAFFGLGLIRKLSEPVAICCTSGTAVCNYYSAISEAYYQKLPLCVITADRNPYYLNQNEEQMIPQSQAFGSMTKCAVTLPMIKDELDFRVCERMVNDALLELTHHGKGPVQINVPIESKISEFNTNKFPDVRKINRWMPGEDWEGVAAELKDKKILVLCGQSDKLTEKEIAILNAFYKKYNCVFSVDILSNMKPEGSVFTYAMSRCISTQYFMDNLKPDIVITINGGCISYIGKFIKNNTAGIKHWAVNANGAITDQFNCITNVFECSVVEFFEKLLSYTEDNGARHSYYEKWLEETAKVVINQDGVEYSDLYAVQEMLKVIPENTLLHLGNSSSVRLAAHYKVDDSIEVYCNRGTNGIDGSASSFIAQSYLHEDLSVLVIGDLSFFYDMNSLWNGYVKKNVRILLNNNEGAGLFHFLYGEEKFPDLNKNIAAGHTAVAKGWVESRGFIYLPVTNKDELKESLETFFDANLDKPVFMEVFTDKKQDARILKDLYKSFDFSDKGSILKKYGDKLRRKK